MDDLEAIAKAIGFERPFTALDGIARDALGLDRMREAKVAIGSGSLRALLLTIAGDHDVRGRVARLGQHLLHSAPHVLWVILAVDAEGRRVCIGIPSAAQRGAR